MAGPAGTLRVAALAEQEVVQLGISQTVLLQTEERVFHSIVVMQAAINRFVKEANQNPQLFRWTKGPDEIIAAARSLSGHPSRCSMLSVLPACVMSRGIAP